MSVIFGGTVPGGISPHLAAGDKAWYETMMRDDVQAAVESEMQERAAKLWNKDVYEVAQAHGRTPGHMWRLICTFVASGHLLLLANLVSMPAQEVRQAFVDGTCTQEQQQAVMKWVHFLAVVATLNT